MLLTPLFGDGLLRHGVLWGLIALVEVLHTTQIVHVFWIGLAMTALYPIMVRSQQLHSTTKTLRLAGLVIILLGIALLLRDVI